MANESIRARGQQWLFGRDRSSECLPDTCQLEGVKTRGGDGCERDTGQTAEFEEPDGRTREAPGDARHWRPGPEGEPKQ